MTCIIGLKHKGQVYMIGDSAAGYERTTQTRKVFTSGKLVIGYTTSFRMGQILQFDENMPDPKPDQNDKYIATDFIPHVRAILKANGFLKVENLVEEGGQFLVGVLGDLYIVHSDFSFHQYAEPFLAIGCGREYALGAMSILCRNGATKPKGMLRKAIKVAASFDGGVRAPFYICKG